MEFIVSKDKMRAYVVLSPVEIAVPYEEIIRRAQEKGIARGLLSKLEDRRKAGEPLLIAEAKMPEAQETALEFLKEPKKLPRWQDALIWNEDTALDLPVEVKREEVIAKIQEKSKEQIAWNVLGEKLSVPARKLELPFAEGVYIREGNVISALDGHLFQDQGKISVEPLLVIEGDVGKVTGDIQFPGMVLVKGNIKSALKVQAKRNIVITGAVEAAQLSSKEGSIFIQGGIKGGKAAQVFAGEEIYCKFAEFASLSGREICVLEAILHCDVTASEALHLPQGKGAIVGGSIKVGRGLFAKVVGSRSFVYTEIQVASEAQQALIDELKKMEEEIAQKSRILRRWGIAKSRQLTKSAEERIQELKMKMKPLQEELEKSLCDTRLEIEDRIYPGTLIRFLGEEYELSEEKEKITIRKPSFFSPIQIQPMSSSD